ncbi:D-TA family PLP-dependent enzyme [Telluribacter sp.]|jgi:D-serine deaminase-like pyridoxal phosphate-dependent protein|uniref:D-TA family PLP-dependent enzyme n=1 Tax=Telluribacter sp. TaxID=1978767 RepID=UPI002E0DB825|nr:D-TA family PLP-dependent enzyme [Telluribacter sp.]
MWYQLHSPDSVDSPSLLVYKERVADNIQTMQNFVNGQADRLVPHVKTHKMKEVVQMQLAAGINKFKCATIAEAEMLAEAGAPWVLLAYQLVGPKVDRYLALAKHYPQVQFGSLVDNDATAHYLNNRCGETGSTLGVFIDVNNGMDRSGHPINGQLLPLYQTLSKLPNLRLQGLHVYDGHIRNEDFAERTKASDAAFEKVYELREHIRNLGQPEPMIIAGGSPTFTVHAQREGIYCSPGTCLLWDWGYGDRFQDQPFSHAAVLLTRVISKPAPGIITTDLGHKAVAAENPIDLRFRFLNLEGYQVMSQSEEHGVVQVSNWDNIQVGQVLYAIPYHICPTVALHDSAFIIENGEVVDKWRVVARNRTLTF